MNGKRFSWQGVAKLPFIEEDRLLLETGKVEETLSAEERLRNCISADKLLISSSHPLAPSVIALYNRYAYMRGQCQVEAIEEIDPIASQGMNGFITLGNEDPCPATIPSPVRGMLDITNNQVLSVTFRNPPRHRHIAKPPEGVKMPTKTISQADIKQQPLWHEDTGQRPHSQDRSPGSSSNDAARRIVQNSLQQRNNSANMTGGGQERQQRQLTVTSPGGGGLRDPPSPNQHKSQGRGRPVGPPGYPVFTNTPANLQYGRGQNTQNISGSPTYSGGKNMSSHYQRPQYSGAGYYPPQHQAHQVIPRAPPVHGGHGFMGRGGNPLPGMYSAHLSPTPVSPVLGQQAFGGPRMVTQNSYVVSENRGAAQGQQGKGRGGRYSDQSRY